ncbi:MAG: GumN family protein [Myxococcaceae bacterium]|nr:GumN family protein [Myxococcaceae bacterium]
MFVSLPRATIFACRALLLALVACTSAAPKPPVAAPASVQAPAHPAGLFLYEVRGKHGSSFLLGTIHLGFGFDEVLTPAARAHFDQAREVMTEADVSAADPEQMLQAALLPPERSLRSILGEATWKKLLARIDAQIPALMLERLEPWLPTVMLSLEDLGKALAELKPGAETRQMDLELMKEAKARGKKLSHFETVQEQLAVFASIAIDEQVRELRRLLDENGVEQARRLLQNFASGDEDALCDSLFDEAELKNAPVFYDRVLFDRNARWLPSIVREVDEGGTFIAVGAGHLLGERGIVAELRRRGYSVTRVE